MKNLMVAIFCIFKIAFINAQNHLDVSGDAQIEGRLDLWAHQNDMSSIHLGYNAGILTDFGAMRCNTFIGSSSGRNNLMGEWNTFVGDRAGFENTMGRGNSFVGREAGLNNTSGIFNSFLGYEAGRINSDGSQNTFLGVGAGQENVHGHRNTLIGKDADFASGDSLDGSIALGYRAKVDCQHCAVIGGTGDFSVKLGINTAKPLWRMVVKDTSNALIGSNVDVSNLSMVLAREIDADKTAIGLGFQSSTNFHSIGAAIIHERTGSTSKGKMHFATKTSNLQGDDIPIHMTIDDSGKVGIGTRFPDYRLQVGEVGDGTEARANAWNINSDRRWKKDLRVIDHPIQKLEQLSGYYYYWKVGKDDVRQIGIIAQEVEKVLPEIVSSDDQGYKSVEYGKLSALLIETVKMQQIQLDMMQEEIAELNKKILGYTDPHLKEQTGPTKKTKNLKKNLRE